MKMSKKQIFSFAVNDISALSRSLVKQINNSSDELNHSRMLNFLVKAAGYANWHQFEKNNRANVAQTESIDADTTKAIPELNDLLDDILNKKLVRTRPDLAKIINSATETLSLNERAEKFSREKTDDELFYFKLTLIKKDLQKTFDAINNDILDETRIRVQSVFAMNAINYRRSNVLKKILARYEISPDWFYHHEGEAPSFLTEDSLIQIESKVQELEEKRIALFKAFVLEQEKINAIDSSVRPNFN